MHDSNRRRVEITRILETRKVAEAREEKRVMRQCEGQWDSLHPSIFTGVCFFAPQGVFTLEHFHGDV